MGKSQNRKLLTVRILARSVFKHLGLKNFWAQPERSVCTIKTKMTENQTNFLWEDFRCSKTSEIRTKTFVFQTVCEIGTVWKWDRF